MSNPLSYQRDLFAFKQRLNALESAPLTADLQMASSSPASFSSNATNSPEMWPTTTETVTRYLVLLNEPELKLDTAKITAFCEKFCDIRSVFEADMSGRPVLVVVLFDLRDALNLAQKITDSIYAGYPDFVGFCPASFLPWIEENQGFAFVQAEKPLTQPETFGLLLQGIGETHSITDLANSSQKLVEYFDTRAADKAVQLLNNLNFQGVLLHVSFWNPQAASQQQQQRKVPPPPGFGNFGPIQPPNLAEERRIVDSDVLAMSRRRDSDTRQSSPPRSSNQIDLERIMAGQDTRTTFMIRNIPNKYTQQMLIDLINETHRGKYDFVYLRIDFKNRCNVGYAFINFPDPRDAVSFALKVCGKKWSKFNSEKVCSLTYANIQGRDALIDKFRNSVVMVEDPTYRPKLFKPNGEEEPFPPPTRRIVKHGSLSSDQSGSSLDPRSSDILFPSAHLYAPGEKETSPVPKNVSAILGPSTWLKSSPKVEADKGHQSSIWSFQGPGSWTKPQ